MAEAVPRQLETNESGDAVMKSATDPVVDPAVEPTPDAAADPAVDPADLLAKGKRDLLCGEVPNAVNQLQEACRLLSTKFGETADECGEAYFYYGKALLDLSRMESGVLGNALQGTLDDDDEKSDEKSEEAAEAAEAKASEGLIEKVDITEEEKEKISEQVIDAMLETDDEVKARKGEDKKSEGKEEDKAAGDVEMKEAETEAEKKAKDHKVTEAGDGTEKKGEEEKKESDEAKTDAVEKKADPAEKKETEETKKEAEETKKEAEETEKSEEKDSGEKDKAGKKSDKEGKEEMETDEKAEGETSQEEEEDEEEGEEVGEGDTEEEGEGADKDGEEKEEDVSNLQLAWEMLELAKIIYKRHTKREMKLKLAEAYLKLGEVGLETENYDQSVGDFKECLKLQKELMEPEDRCLAETCYQLGLATGLQGQYDDAVIHYKCAASIIEAKMGKLNAVIEEGEKSGKGKEPACADDPVVAAQKEVKDLQDILPDIMAKIEDILDEQRNAEQVKKMVKENVAGELGESTTGFGTTETSTDDTKAVSDITHLVRKKRKPEDDADETTKKAKTEEEPVASNGTANGTTNGEAKVAETVKAS